MEGNKEGLSKGCSNEIINEKDKKLIEQLGKSICKIKIGIIQGTGFFCKIPFPSEDSLLPVFMTNNHIINNELLKQKNAKMIIEMREEKDFREIDFISRKVYTNKEYDITIIEIKEKDKVNNYLEIDAYIINEMLYNLNITYNFYNQTIYLIQFLENKLSVSYGVLNKIYEDKTYNFNFKCNLTGDLSGLPIFSKKNKIIGINKANNNMQEHLCLFLNFAIKEFLAIEIFLKAFNEKYNLNIEDLTIKSLKLNRYNLEDL